MEQSLEWMEIIEDVRQHRKVRTGTAYQKTDEN